MKRINNIYSDIYDFENLYNAYLEARKNKRYRQDVLKFSANLEENLIQIQNELIYKTYKIGRYREFYVKEPKKRLIMALQFKDRVVQWAIYRQLNPVFDKSFIFDSYGCRKNKGSHRALKRMKTWMEYVSRKNIKYYYLKLDISKYFYRVNHDVLMKILENKIKDKDLMWLFENIIRSEEYSFGLPHGVEPFDCSESERLSDVGMPIGNLTSQMFANIYLNELDQIAKHELKAKYYIRYMDDIIILHHDKNKLNKYMHEIEIFLKNNLKLSLNNKTTIRPIACGLDFVGYRIFPSYIKLRKKSSIRMKRNIKNMTKLYSKGKIGFDSINSCIQSYLGIMRHFNSYRLKEKILSWCIFKKIK